MPFYPFQIPGMKPPPFERDDKIERRGSTVQPRRASQMLQKDLSKSKLIQQEDNNYRAPLYTRLERWLLGDVPPSLSRRTKVRLFFEVR